MVEQRRCVRSARSPGRRVRRRWHAGVPLALLGAASASTIDAAAQSAVPYWPPSSPPVATQIRRELAWRDKRGFEMDLRLGARLLSGTSPLRAL